MSKPRLLDLFCGAGGAAMGYHRAGFEVVGVDIKPQPRYPFGFIQWDALSYLDLMGGWLGDHFDAIHASPPCQAYSEATRRANRSNHPDLIGPLRKSLELSRLPWVIENVPGSPIQIDYRLCGCMFDLGVIRERWFETSYQGFVLHPPCNHTKVVLNTHRSSHGPWFRLHGRVPTRAEIGMAMGIDWMRGDEIKQAIPPAYTEWIGAQLMAHLERAA